MPLPPVLGLCVTVLLCNVVPYSPDVCSRLCFCLEWYGSDNTNCLQCPLFFVSTAIQIVCLLSVCTCYTNKMTAIVNVVLCVYRYKIVLLFLGTETCGAVVD